MRIRDGYGYGDGYFIGTERFKLSRDVGEAGNEESPYPIPDYAKYKSASVVLSADYYVVEGWVGALQSSSSGPPSSTGDGRFNYIISFEEP